MAFAAHAERWSKRDLGALADVAASAPREGLAGDYGAGVLASLQPGTQADSTADPIAMTLARDFFEGSPAIRGDKSWHIARGSLDYGAWVDDVLARHSVSASFASLLPHGAPYAALKKGLARCDRIGGDCAAIAVNMDRLRALPRDVGDRYIWVNIPAFRLDLIEHDRAVSSHRVIVGKPGSQTPSFTAQIDGVTINPWWNVPCSIVDESIGKLIKTNPAEAKRKGYVSSLDAKGKLIVRQKPGPENALGQIKLEMPNPYGVYIHDTPSRDLFANDKRAYSHGCIRTEDPKSLAVTLLGKDGEPQIDMLLATGVSKTLKLSAPIPVYVVYITAEADADGKIVTFDDIYKRDRR